MSMELFGMADRYASTLHHDQRHPLTNNVITRAEMSHRCSTPYRGGLQKDEWNSHACARTDSSHWALTLRNTSPHDVPA
jgi:hypothetical protein